MHRGRRADVLALLIGALCAGPALAQISDTVHPFLSTTINTDDNLLRADANTQASQVESDTYKTVAGGVLFDRPIGRQRLTGSATLSRVTFDRNEQLDYNGKNAKADLAWQIGNHLFGNLGSSYDQTLSSFTDFSTTQQNLRTTKRDWVNGTWRFHPSWQVHGKLSKEDTSYSLDSLVGSNHNDNAAEAGGDFVAASGSTVGLVFRRIESTYPGQANQVDSTFRGDYDQNEAKVNISWLVSGITNVTFLGGYVKRQHPYNSFRDDSGTNGRLIVNWMPTGKLNFTMQGYREFGAAETISLNSATMTGLQGDVTWSATSKISLSATARKERREFEPLSGVTGLTGLTDTTNYQSVGLTYRPQLNLLLRLTGFHDTRNGSIAASTVSYAAKGASLVGSVQF